MSFFRSIGRVSRKKAGAPQQPQQQQQQQPPQQQPHLQQPMQHQQQSQWQNGRGMQQQASQQQAYYGTAPTPLYLLSPYCKAQLVNGSFATIVQLPKYISLDEWLALNVMEFFAYLNEIYGVVSEMCTVQSCPTMSAGPGMDYTWLDGQRKQVRLPAPQYVEYVLAWINNRLGDRTIFPTKAGVDFPPTFHSVVRSIYKQMFRIFAHLYHAHFVELVQLSLEAHFNSFFAHFISFGKEFQLLDRNDVEPLQELIGLMHQQGNTM